MLKFLNGDLFAGGAVGFNNSPRDEHDKLLRIFIPIKIGEIETEAVLDTGGAYFICPPDMAECLNILDTLPEEEIQIRGIKRKGRLVRSTVTLLAKQGESIDVQVNVFIPETLWEENWDLPPYLGWMGCLERVRFAIDPLNDLFYFGSC
jgi:hypothetical protein